MYDSAFLPKGPTYAVSANSPVQILASPDPAYSSVRVVNLAGSVTRFGWISQNTNPGNVNIAAPSTTTPVVSNLISIPANASEVISIPMNSWVQSSAATEVTPGEGIK